jgi:16S rRNA A1518/A1519 N6-dimethyltransferase RsmA/KsgA/DIM1 with predicted DNA glycosylase/AP lyase activity
MKGKAGGEALEILSRAGLSGERRPETLDIEEFTRLAGALEVFYE